MKKVVSFLEIENLIQKRNLKELEEIDDPEALDALIEALKHDYYLVRAAAATALGNLGHEKSVEPLSQALNKEKYTKPALEMIQALEKTGDPRSIPSLNDAQNWSEPSIQTAASKALDNLRKQEIILEEESSKEIENAEVNGPEVLEESETVKGLEEEIPEDANLESEIDPEIPASRITFPCGHENSADADFCVVCGKNPSLIECENCGKENNKEARFCTSCAEPMEKIPQIKCANCGFLNPDNARFCTNCAQPLIKGLKINCPECGTENVAEARYCQQCAFNLKPGGKISPVSSPGQGRVKQNTSTSNFQSNNPEIEPGLSAGEAILIILFSPIAGLIGFLVWNDNKPKKAKESCIIGIIMLVIVLFILF
ncbi:hypothetical protein JCM15415_18420 [Methanobacterium movens]